MIFSLRGRIAAIGDFFVVLECNNIGYQVAVSHPDSFGMQEEVVLYIHEIIREDEHSLVGFNSLKEKELFLSLIKVNGIGPKTAITLLSGTNPDTLSAAISCNNVAYIRRLPGVGPRMASQIILDLKGKLTDGHKGNPNVYEDVKLALKDLGFKGTVIERVLADINIPNASEEEILKAALTRLNSLRGTK